MRRVLGFLQHHGVAWAAGINQSIKRSKNLEVLAKYRLDKLGKRPADSEARAESSLGFRPKEAAGGGSGSSKVVEFQGGVEKSKPADQILVKVNSAPVITSGLDFEGKLRISKCLADPEVEGRVKRGLSAFNTRNDKDLLFDPKLPQQRIDQWLREVLHLLFEFLDRRYPEDAAPAYHWVLVGKSRHTVYVLQRTIITGEELEEAKGLKAQKRPEHAIRITTKNKITTSLLGAGFDDALEKVMAGQEFPSESEAESAPERTVRRKSRSSKAVAAPKVATEEDIFSSEASESDDEELEDAEEDATVRQRSKKSSLFGAAEIRGEEVDHDGKC
ncbi:hypothetical protein B0H13DRAFT_2334535 [Mycena leptocephala]|nr:hypothetical protein B0H13DRAFT_2334535 [Mycena leptocephala]